MSTQALATLARKHWAEWLPERTKALKAEGLFGEATHGAAMQAQQEILDLQQKGYQLHEAEEVALKHYILLEPEPEAYLEDWEREELAEKEAEYRRVYAEPSDDLEDLED